LSRFDVAVIGGGAIGSSVAYFLLGEQPALRVAVVEPDPAYELASTPRASGGARRLFSCPENIAMSMFGVNFIRALPEVGWKQGGYLFIVPESGVTTLEANWRTQIALGARVELLDRDALARRFPSMNVSDLAAGAWSPEDGWCDPYSLLQALRREAQSLGAAYVQDRVIAFAREGTRVRTATLESGITLSADHFVDAAGAWAGLVGAMAGLPLPIAPQRRFEHYFETPNAIEPLPYRQGPRPTRVPARGARLFRRLGEPGRAARIQLRRRPRLFRVGRVARAGAPLCDVRGGALQADLVGSLRSVRTRRQPDHWQLTRHGRQLLRCCRILRPRHDACACRGPRDRRAHRSRRVSNDRSRAARLR
jgi:glycine/D-amino acid oxidase-like deaminating enzyme